MGVDVREARRAELSAALLLRVHVFCGEQGVSLGAEQDGRDAAARHVVALSDGAIVGTCRVLVDGEAAQIGRMAVASDWRRRGVGAALLDEAERLAATHGATHASLHAQRPAEAFYARNGYRSAGEPFLQEGIEHVAMEKRIA